MGKIRHIKDQSPNNHCKLSLTACLGAGQTGLLPMRARDDCLAWASLLKFLVSGFKETKVTTTKIPQQCICQASFLGLAQAKIGHLASELWA